MCFWCDYLCVCLLFGLVLWLTCLVDYFECCLLLLVGVCDFGWFWGLCWGFASLLLWLLLVLLLFGCFFWIVCACILFVYLWIELLWYGLLLLLWCFVWCVVILRFGCLIVYVCLVWLLACCLVCVTLLADWLGLFVYVGFGFCLVLFTCFSVDWCS